MTFIGLNNADSTVSTKAPIDFGIPDINAFVEYIRNNCESIDVSELKKNESRAREWFIAKRTYNGNIVKINTNTENSDIYLHITVCGSSDEELYLLGKPSKEVIYMLVDNNTLKKSNGSELEIAFNSHYIEFTKVGTRSHVTPGIFAKYTEGYSDIICETSGNRRDSVSSYRNLYQGAGDDKNTRIVAVKDGDNIRFFEYLVEGNNISTTKTREVNIDEFNMNTINVPSLGIVYMCPNKVIEIVTSGSDIPDSDNLASVEVITDEGSSSTDLPKEIPTEGSIEDKSEEDIEEKSEETIEDIKEEIKEETKEETPVVTPEVTPEVPEIKEETKPEEDSSVIAVEEPVKEDKPDIVDTSKIFKRKSFNDDIPVVPEDFGSLLSNAAGTLQKCSSVIVEHKAIIDGLNSKVAELESTISEQLKNINGLTDDISITVTEKQEAIARKEALEEENAKLMKECDDLKKIIAELEGSNLDFKDEVASRNSEIASLNSKVDKITNDISEITNQVASYKRTISELEDKVDRKRDKIDSRDSIIDNLQCKVDKKTYKMRQMKETIETLTNDFKEKDTTLADKIDLIEEKDECIKELTEKIIEKDNEICKLKDDMDGMCMDKDACEGQNNNLKSKITSMEQDAAKMLKVNANLRELVDNFINHDSGIVPPKGRNYNINTPTFFGKTNDINMEVVKFASTSPFITKYLKNVVEFVYNSCSIYVASMDKEGNYYELREDVTTECDINRVTSMKHLVKYVIEKTKFSEFSTMKFYEGSNSSNNITCGMCVNWEDLDDDQKAKFQIRPYSMIVAGKTRSFDRFISDLTKDVENYKLTHDIPQSDE
jgi:predicted  nucleic acid-binding Zn-ribbon protein